MYGSDIKLDQCFKNNKRRMTMSKKEKIIVTLFTVAVIYDAKFHFSPFTHFYLVLPFFAHLLVFFLSKNGK